MTEPQQPMPLKPTKSLQIWCVLGLLLLGLAVRWPHLHQSLWYDEMTTTVEYVLQPWSKILAGGAGEYVPNNHVFHTILVKTVYTLGGGSMTLPPSEALLRLPALLAGILIPIALAWPIRQRDPPLALLVAILAAVHPWLLSFSVESRGYSLLLLLGIVATNCLPLNNRRAVVTYVITLSLAIFTIPLAVLLVPAHAVAMLVVERIRIWRWCIAAGSAVALAGFLYLPMAKGLISYYRHPYLATMNYRHFLNALPRFALLGSDATSNSIYWALPVLAIIFGSVLGWSRVAIRPALLSLGTITLVGIVFPLIVSGATEVRFVPWIAPWFCVAVAVVLASAKTKWARVAATLGFLTLIGWLLIVDIHQPPNQPIREGISLADRIVPPGRDIMVLYLGARESIALYGDTAHVLLPAPDVNSVPAAQQKSLHDTGHLPWVVIFYEQLASDRNLFPPESRGLWTGLTKHYHLAAPRLPGRIAPVAVYAPDQDE